MFSGIFIDRARFAIVIAVVITLAGLIAKRHVARIEMGARTQDRYSRFAPVFLRPAHVNSFNMSHRTSSRESYAGEFITQNWQNWLRRLFPTL
jgi:hypothetical protein